MGIKTKERAALGKAADAAASPLLSNAALKRMYATMLQCRALEERAALLLKRWPITPNAGSPAFQEAIKVGCAIDLLPEDMIASQRPDFSVHFIRGLPLDAMLSRSCAWRDEGDEASPARQGTFGVGVRMANKLKKTGRVVLAFSAPHASGLSREVLGRAASESLPIVFVLDNRNNRLLCGTGAAPPAGAKTKTAVPVNHGFPGIPVDGNDVVAVYRVAHEAVTRARRGDGPTLIECKTYCLDYSSKGPSKARDAEHAGGPDQKAEKDPIHHMEQYLKHKGLFEPAWKNQVLQKFLRQLDAIAGKPGYSSPSTEHAS